MSPLDLPVGLPMELELKVPAFQDLPSEEPVPEEVIRDRLRRLAAATGTVKGVPPIPLEALRRENLYEERL
jgi:hypothetical protein